MLSGHTSFISNIMSQNGSSSLSSVLRNGLGEQDQDKIRKYMDKRLSQIETQFKQIVKNIKPIVMKEAVKWVQEQSV